MDLGEAVTTRALAASELTGLVDDRVYFKKRTQGSGLPVLVLHLVGGPPEDLDLDDVADSVETRIQFSAIAATHAAAHAVLKAATDAFIGSFEVDQFLFWEGDRERPIDLGSDTTAEGFIHEVTQDVVVRHSLA